MFLAKNIKRIVLLMLVFILSFTFCFNLLGSSARIGASSEIDSLQSEYDALEKKRLDLAEEILAAQEKQLEEKEEQNALEEQIRIIEDQVENLYDQKYTLEASIAEKEVEIEEKQEEVTETYELFKSRLRAMYIEGNISSLELLFSSQGFSEFLTNVEYTKRISKHDNELIEKLLNEKQDLQDLKDDLDADYEKLLEAQEELELKMDELDTAYRESEKRLSDLEATESELEEQQDLTKEQQEKVDAEIQKAIEEANKKAVEEGRSPSYSYTDGKYIWPTPGFTSITSDYGYRIHPVTGAQKFHAGIDISGGGINGTSILASNSGTVIFVGWDSGGYGNYVMVDHGGGVVTLYAHCSKVVASYGQYVEKGDIIAKVGSTGMSTGPHLHFEVRVNGQTTQPLNYVSPS